MIIRTKYKLKDSLWGIKKGVHEAEEGIGG